MATKGHTLAVLPPIAPSDQESTVSAENLASRKYLHWQTAGVEVIPPGEEDDINAVAEQINLTQRNNYDAHRHAFTGTHIRTQGIVKGTFTVNDDLPAHLRQGELFTSPGASFPAACRYSTEPNDPGLDDRNPEVRGFAMKLFDVSGDFFDQGKDIPTQDFEFNSTPTLDLTDAKTTREIFDLRIKYASDPRGLERELSKRPDAELQLARSKIHNTHPGALRQFSQSAYRWGDHVAKYSLVPTTETQRALWHKTISKDDDARDVIHGWLHDFHAESEAKWSFQVQLLENLDEQSVEYVGSDWDPERYPWQEVGVLTIPPQESWNYERMTFWTNRVRLNPWYGLKAYQPLGGSNRLRRVVYPASSRLRRELNACPEVHVKSIDEIP